MAKSNNVLLVLTVVLLLVPLFTTFTLLSNITFEAPPAGPSPAIQHGYIGVTILPESHDSATGEISVKILPEE